MANKETLYWIGRGSVQIGGKSFKKGDALPDAPKDKDLAKKWDKDVEKWKEAGLVSASPDVLTKGRPTNDEKAVKDLEAQVEALKKENAELKETIKALTEENAELNEALASDDGGAE